MGSGNNNNYSGKDRRNNNGSERRLNNDRRITVRFEDVLGRRSGVERRVTVRPNP